MFAYKHKRKYYLSDGERELEVTRVALMALCGFTGMEGVERFGVSFPQRSLAELTENDLRRAAEELEEFDEMTLPFYARLMDRLENDPPETFTEREFHTLMRDAGFYRDRFPEQFAAAEAEYERRQSA